MQADARRTAGSRLSGGQGPQHSSSELQGGGREVTGALGDVGRVERVPTTRRLIAQLLPLPLPLLMPMHVGTGDAVSLFFLVSLGSDAVGRPGCGVVRESVGGTLRMKVNNGDDLGPFPHTSALLRSGAAVQLGGGGGGWMDIGESTLRSPLPQEFPPQHGQCSSRPRRECVTAFYWLGLFDAWLRWHVIGRREGWVEELTLHSPPPVSRLQANKHMAPSHAPAKRWASHDRSSTLGSSAAAAAAKVPRALSSASIAMDPSSLDACLNWWRRWAGPLPPTMSRQTPLSPCPC